jgi:ABC-type uncharacterized transport system permease subunit
VRHDFGRSAAEFDRDFARTRAAIRRGWRIQVAAVLAVWCCIGVAGVWLVMHPEAIGRFVGQVVAGFGDVR